MLGLGADRPGQAEVGDLDPAVVGDQDVLGLDVAVDQARRGGRRRARRRTGSISASALAGDIGASLRITSRSVWPGT